MKGQRQRQSRKAKGVVTCGVSHFWGKADIHCVVGDRKFRPADRSPIPTHPAALLPRPARPVVWTWLLPRLTGHWSASHECGTTVRDPGQSAPPLHSAAGSSCGPAPIPEARFSGRGHLPRHGRSDPPKPQDQIARSAKPGIQIDGGNHRLHRVAKKGHASPSAGAHLGFAKPHCGAQINLTGHIGAGPPCAPAR